VEWGYVYIMYFLLGIGLEKEKSNRNREHPETKFKGVKAGVGVVGLSFRPIRQKKPETEASQREVEG
jgi:hypothetical protein